MNASQAQKKFNTLADVEFQSRTQNRLLVVYKEIVYDLTTFSSRHPGGAAAIMDHRGKAIDNVIFNPSYYKHNPRVLDKIAQFKVGYIEPPAVQKPNQPSKIIPQQQTRASTAASSSNVAKDIKLQNNPPNQLKSQQQQAAVQNKPGNYQQQQQPQQIVKQQLIQQQQQQQAKYETDKQQMLQKQQQQQQQQQQQYAKHNSQYQISSSSGAVQQQPQLKQTQSQPSSQRLVKGQQQQSSTSSSMQLQQQQSQLPTSRERESSLGKKLAEEIVASQAIKTNPTSNTNTHNNNKDNNNMHTSIHLEDNDQKDKLNVSKTTKMSITSDRSIKGVKDFLMNAEQHRLPSTIPDLNQLQILSNKSIPHPEDSNTPTNSPLKDLATPKLSNYYSSDAHKTINADNVTDGFKLTNINDPFEDYYDLDVPNDETIRINALPPLLPTIFFHRRH